MAKERITAKERQTEIRALEATPWLFLSPVIFLFFFVYVIPLIYTGYQSVMALRSTSGSGFGGVNETVFVGAEHYLVSISDSAFLWSIGRMIAIGVIQVPIMLGFALSLALMLDSRRCYGRRAYNLAYFLPYAIPGVVSALMWAYLVQPSLSPFTQLMSKINIDFDMTAPVAIPFTIGNMITWGFTGYNMVIMYAALKALPKDLMEAAYIDGAGPWTVAWKIKVPLIRPAIVMTAVFSIIGTIQLYNEPAILRNATANVDQSYSPIMAVYYLVQNNDFSGAAARSIILAIITFVLSFGFLKYQQKRGGAF
ncbi:MAG: sugar ABC transporter permease [Actinomycetaceae bacterium]|nr:sugar ABC transporter permease [Actinomycetaceae bacterium]